MRASTARLSLLTTALLFSTGGAAIKATALTNWQVACLRSAVAALLLSRSLEHVPAVDASLLLLAEPAFSPVWAWLVHHEIPGFWPVLGGAVIVGSTTWKTWRDARLSRSTATAS